MLSYCIRHLLLIINRLLKGREGQRPKNMDKPLKLGLLGFGTVGTGCTRSFSATGQSSLTGLAGIFEVAKILVRDLDKPRGVEVIAAC